MLSAFCDILIADSMEHWICVKFCFILSTTALEIHAMLEGKNSMERTQIFEWCSLFKYGEVSVEIVSI
jgi:hypothetical protein